MTCKTTLCWAIPASHCRPGRPTAEPGRYEVYVTISGLSSKLPSSIENSVPSGTSV